VEKPAINSSTHIFILSSRQQYTRKQEVIR